MLKSRSVCPIAWPVCLMLWPAAAGAQVANGSIAGMVKDTTGAVLPGVTVEASSPALIEKTRTVVTDGAGEYKIIELRPGTYTVTFTLPGFNTAKRDGIELTTGFTAPVNADLRVGSVAETVTVSGESPIVDVQNTKQQAVMTRTVVDALPTGKQFQDLGVLIPGMVASGSTTPTSQDVGGQNGFSSHSILAIHGGRAGDQQPQLDGMSIASVQRIDSLNLVILDGGVQEYAIDVAGQSAETEAGGVRFNLIPREGSNVYRGSLFGNFTTHSLQSDNLTPTLISHGLTSVNSVQTINEINPSVGGPAARDKLWFYFTYGHAVTNDYVAGMFVNRTPTAWTPTFDKTQPAVDDLAGWMTSLRLTWQASRKNKVTGYYHTSYDCECHQSVAATVTPEAAHVEKHFDSVYQLTWASPVTERLLFDAGLTRAPYDVERAREPNSTAAAITDIGTGITSRSYNGVGGFFTDFNTPYSNTNMRASVSYVTGSHAAKVGASLLFINATEIGTHAFNDSFTVLNGRPTSVTYYISPYSLDYFIRPNLGLFAQDQWTLKRITLNGGLRFSWLRTGYPDQAEVPTQFTPIRSYSGAGVLNWKDLTPRLGAAWDIFGNGKTAVKASVNKYVIQEARTFTYAVQPVAVSGNSNTRSWNDTNGDYVVQGNPLNPAANGELGPSTNANFGLTALTTHYDPSWENGWNVRPSQWEMSGGVQHELVPGLSATAAYFRRIYTNFSVLYNSADLSTDFSGYCVTAPLDPRLPGGGGNQVCGLYDLAPAKVGQIANLRTSANNVGNQYEHWNGLDVTLNARLRHGLLLQGGVSTGKQVTDNCDLVNKIPSIEISGSTVTTTQFCHVEYPWLSQVKLLGSYSLPWGIQAAATFQSLPGPNITANFVATNAQVAPSLGRNLSSSTTATINIVPPGLLYGDRLNEFDLRFSKAIKLGGTVNLRGIFDIYNLFNASPALSVNNTYGTNGAVWQNPTQILAGRLFKFGAQMDF
jgi:hypothetical protein